MKRGIFSVFKHVVLGSVIASRAVASVVPMHDPKSGSDDTWTNMRREMESREPSTIRASLQHWIGNDGHNLALRDAIEQSYQVAGMENAEEVDTFWMDLMRVSGDASMIATFLEVRGAMDVTTPRNREQYLKDWLYKTKGDYCFGNCGIGNGNGGGNGTSNEGNGQGSDKDFGI